MSATTVPVTNLVLFLNARKVPRTEIDRIVVILINYNKASTGNIVANIGAKYINTVRKFMKLEQTKYERRITDALTTVESMEGEDTATKRARLETVMLAVHTLREMSQSKR
jgi:hypothetical protein